MPAFMDSPRVSGPSWRARLSDALKELLPSDEAGVPQPSS
jgi:hypothetical protein